MIQDPDTVHVRYLVDDVEAAVNFYVTHLGFTVLTPYGSAFADVKRGNLRLLLSGPASSAGRPMPDGRQPGPGGWNRIHLLVDDIEAEVARLREAGVTFRSDEDWLALGGRVPHRCRGGDCGTGRGHRLHTESRTSGCPLAGRLRWRGSRTERRCKRR